MHLWIVLVLALLIQALNYDFDRLAELANKHSDMRHMLRGIASTQFPAEPVSPSKCLTALLQGAGVSRRESWNQSPRIL